VREQIESILTEIVQQPPTDEELALAKGMLVAEHRMGLQTNGSLAQTMALDTIYGMGADDWESYEDRVDEVTAEQVQQMAQRLLDLDHAAVIVTTPGDIQTEG
jgi:zinc protease